MRTIYRAFATALVLIQTACFNDSTADRTVVYQPVTAYQVVEQPGFEILRSFTGVVQPAQSAEVGFELGGTIKLFPVDEGDRVAAGDQLASLDKSLLKVERRQLEAQVVEATATRRLILANLERQASLESEGYASRQRRDELVASRDATEAELRRLEAALDGNDVRIQKATLIASFDGVVSERFMEVGSAAAPGVPVLKLLEIGRMEAHIGVPGELSASLSPGDLVTLTVAGTETLGEVLAVGAELKARSHAVVIRVALADSNVLAGTVVELQLTDLIREPGFVIPKSSLTASMRGLWRVYVLQPEGDSFFRIEARDLQLRYSGESHAFVTGGLHNGEKIVADGLHKMVPGQRVRSIEAG